MPGLPFFDESAPGPIRVPAVEITIGSGGDSSGFGGIADAASALLGAPQSASWADHLVTLSIKRGFAPNVDYADLVITDTEGAPNASLGDEGSIAIGAAGATESYFKGAVISVQQRGDGMRRYRLSGAGHVMAHTRFNQSVNNMSAAEAMEFAASEAGQSVQISIGGSDDSLAQYVFDDARSAWEHTTYLAQLRGSSVWVDADNTIQVADQLEQGDSVAVFTYGEDLLESNIGSRSAHTSAVTAFGGSRADDGFILRKQGAPNRSEAGSGSPQRFYRDGVLQSQQDLSTRVSAQNLFGHRQTTSGEVLVTGSAALAPGSTIELANLPGDNSGKYLIRSVQSVFDSTRGWSARLQISQAGDVPSLPGLPAGLGELL